MSTPVTPVVEAPKCFRVVAGDSANHQIRTRVKQCGSFARDLLRDRERGGVLAIFTSSFYLESGDAIACIGNESIHAGSLNVNTTASRKVDWAASGLKVGDPWHVVGKVLHVGARSMIVIDGIDRSTPATDSPECRSALDVNAGVEELRLLCELRGSVGGLGRSGAGRVDTSLRNTSLAPIEALRSWLTAAMSGGPRSQSTHPLYVHRLVGLGPGLTPAGDDYLCGVMLTLHRLGRADIAKRLWTCVCPSARDAGNLISFGHLAAAAAGGESDPIDGLLSALLGCTGGIGPQLDVIDAVGHTSGRDCVAGVLMTAECWLDSQPARPRSFPRPVPS